MSVYRCAGCGAVNSTRAALGEEHAACWRCRRPLDRSGRPQPVDAAALVTTVRSSAAPILVAFSPRGHDDAGLDGLARVCAGELVALRVYPEEEPAAADGYAVTRTPTLLLFHTGSEVARRTGPSSPADLLAWMERSAAPA